MYTSAYILVQLVEGERQTAFKMLLHRNVGANLWMCFRKRAVGKVGSLFSPTNVGKLGKKKERGGTAAAAALTLAVAAVI